MDTISGFSNLCVRVCVELKFGFREQRDCVCGAQILILLEKRQCGNQVSIHQGFVPDFNPTSFGHVDEVKMSKSFSSNSPTSCEQMFVDGEKGKEKRHKLPSKTFAEAQIFFYLYQSYKPPQAVGS